MAISKAEKAVYNDEIKDLKVETDTISKEVNELMLKKRKTPNIESYYNLEIVSKLLKLLDIYVKMSDLSLEILSIKNEKFLNEGRKEFYKVLQMMEDIVGSDIERSLRDNDEGLAKIDKFNPKDILDIVKRINFSLETLKNRFGEGSKWKWSFVELQARVAVIAKNITNFSDVAKLRDPRTEFFRERLDLMDICKEWLTEAAKQYRTKYEMAGKARDDLKKSIALLVALRKIYVLFGEDEEATKLKNTIDAAKQILASEDKEKNKKKK